VTPHVLVCAAGKHNATMEIAVEIADRIGRVLGPGAVDVQPIGRTPPLDRYPAVVIGSAVYVGHWRPEALDFVRTNATALRTKDVWLFSSGPIGDPPMPAGPPADVEELIGLTRAHDHVVFGGRLDRRLLTWPERAVVRALRVQPGDHRDWPTIEEWAHGIGRSLAATEKS